MLHVACNLSKFNLFLTFLESNITTICYDLRMSKYMERGGTYLLVTDSTCHVVS